MNASSFNPLAVARELEAAGIEADHAEAIAEGIRQGVSADRDDPATKADLANLELRLDKWGVGIAVASVGIIVAAMKLL